MKILFVSSDFCRTGASLAMTELAEQVKRMGNDVLLLFPRESDATNDARKRGLDCVVVRSYEWLAPLARKESLRERIRWALKHLWNQAAIRRIAALIEKEHIDIVHNNSLWGYVGAVAARRTGRPYVWHMREMLEHQQHKKMRWEKYAEKLVSGADARIAISKAVLDYYAGRFQGAETHLVYDGVDVEKMRRPGHGLFRESTVKVIAPGRVHPNKRQMDVVQAVEILLREGIDIELSIVGEDNTPYGLALKEYVGANGLGRSVAFRGETADVASWWARSDISVTSSQYEAFGRVTAEAMLAGCVAVVSNSGANEEIVTDGETGYVYRLGDPVALAGAIKRILADKKKAAACAAAGRESVARRFSNVENARRVAELYEAVLAKRASGGK